MAWHGIAGGCRQDPKGWAPALTALAFIRNAGHLAAVRDWVATAVNGHQKRLQQLNASGNTSRPGFYLLRILRLC